MAGTWTDLTASAIRYLLSSTTQNVSTNLVRKCCSWLLYFLLDYLSVKRVCVCVCVCGCVCVCVCDLSVILLRTSRAVSCETVFQIFHKWNYSLNTPCH